MIVVELWHSLRLRRSLSLFRSGGNLGPEVIYQILPLSLDRYRIFKQIYAYFSLTISHRKNTLSAVNQPRFTACYAALNFDHKVRDTWFRRY